MAEIPPTRASLLVRLREPQDEKAWAQFVALYTPLVFGYARKQGLQDADAADVCQEVLGAVSGAIGRLDYDPAHGSFHNWLFTVVRRKLSNWRRAQECRTRGSGDSEVNRLLEECPAPDDTEAEWESEFRDRLFAWACEQVRPEVSAVTWGAFWRTAIEDQPGKQVAAALGLSITAVYSARSRVLARLKELIQSAQET